MEAVTNIDLTGISFIGKTGFEDNDAPTGPNGENIGVRGVYVFQHGTFFLEADTGTANEITVRAKDGGAAGSIPQKLYLGRYIQVGNEIMRVSSTTFQGANQNIVTVIRGALGTDVANHPTNSKVRAIEVEAVELRRPSILRASGHTFEYIGYGPGNYSTSLPQLQVRQLPENETYLVQAQEMSCGQVVYTGMNDQGDFYIGNTKYSATSGTQVTFDVPIPTVAGQNAASNSVVFDEVIVNRRLFVGGGETKEVLSQFDGPVKFTNSVAIQNKLTVTDTASLFRNVVTSEQNSTAPTNGAFQVRGGGGVEKDFYVGGTLYPNQMIITGDLTMGPDGVIYTNKIDAADVNKDVELFYNTTNPSYPVGFGTALGKVVFRTEVPGTGEGGESGIDASDGGVDIKGSLVVREKVIAREFIGDGLGKPGSVIMWGGSDADIPDGYLLCNGAVLNVANYAKLFAAIGNIHGGDGVTTFAVPDLRGKFIAGAAGAYAVAATGGADTVTLTADQLGAHTHVTSTVDTSHSHPSTLTIDENDAAHDHVGSATGGNHSHSGSTSGGGGHSHGYQYPAMGNHCVQGGPNCIRVCVGQGGSSTGGGNHSHGVTISGEGTHNHTVTVNSGQGNSHPYTYTYC